MNQQIDWSVEPADDRERQVRAEYLKVAVEQRRYPLSAKPDPLGDLLTLSLLRPAGERIANDLAQAIEGAERAFRAAHEQKMRARHEAALAEAIRRVDEREPTSSNQ